jgi:hypothetical protein
MAAVGAWVCVQAGARVAFYRRARRRRVGRWSWALHNEGRCGWDKAATKARRRRRVVAWPLGIDGRVARASWAGAGYRAWQIAGSRPDRWPVASRWGSRLGAACRRKGAPPRGGASLSAGAEQGRGEKSEGGREKSRDSN